MTIPASPDILKEYPNFPDDGAVFTAPQIKIALERLDRLLAEGISALTTNYGPQAGQDNYRGLYISPEDITHILSREPGDSLLGEADSPELTNLIPDTDPGTIFSHVQQLFSLGRFDLNLIVLALAPELDVRYERLYAYLQDDVTRRRPSVDLALNLLCPTLAAKIEARRHLTFLSPLIRHRLIEVIEDPAQPRSPLIKKYIKLDERIVSYFCGDNTIDSRLIHFVHFIVPKTTIQSLELPAVLTQRMGQLFHEARLAEQRTIFYFHGEYGVGKQGCAEALCSESQLNLLVADIERVLADETMEFETAVHLTIREAILQNSVIYWTGFDKLLADKQRMRLVMFLKTIEKGLKITFLSGHKTWEPSDILRNTPFIRIRFNMPAYGQRLKMWKKFFNGNQPDKDVALDIVANKFRLSGGQIKDAVSTARNLAKWRKPERAIPNMRDLHTACQLQSNRKLGTLAQKIPTCFHWQDIVLPSDQTIQLKTICTYVRQRAKVMDTWGFDRKLSLGKGINALFTGPSGTGKTMAADVIANELVLDLYKIDLSTIISKYIGETEKNLAQIFNEAETSNAVLFFDEADALFGKRSEVKDSHDRYANIEISYLLQRMEEYEGVSILATNLRQNMDDAFVRRVAFTIHFPMPEKANRLTIWQNIWPPETPKDPGLDLEFLAQHFRFSGGNIKNIALASAYLAAEEGKVVTMRHLIRATKEELLKMGKACVKSDFGKYYELL